MQLSALAALALLASPALAQVRPDAVMLRYPDVSRDHIVFRYDSDLWLVEKEGGTARRLTSAPGNESFPRFSPDGRSIAFVGAYDGGSDLYVLPVDAGAPRRVTHHPDQEVLSEWTPDGEGLLFWSSATSGIARASKVYRVAASGGQPEELPVPYGTFGSLDASGRRLAYTPHSREFRTWKRYRGGRAADVWLYDLETGEAENVTDDPANDQLPMWYGDEVVFLSDRGEYGVMNLWSYDTRTGETRKLTDFRQFDVSFPSMGPEDVVFEAGGKLYRYVLATGERVQVDVVIPGERPDLRPRTHDVSELVQSAGVGPTGKRVVLEARGEVFSAPVEEGVTRNLTRTSGVAEREPAWSPDGRWIAYVSDRSGEYEVVLRRADGSSFEGADEHGERRLTELGPGWKQNLSWSPRADRLAFATNDGGLHVVDVESGEHRRIHQNPMGFPVEVEWSPDGRWLAWSHRHSETRLDALQLYDLEAGELHEVTSGLFDDSEPTFDRSGDWLYFRSSRTFDPIYADLDTTWIYANGRNVCAVPLRADVESPFLPEDDEEEVRDLDAEEDEDDADEGEEGDGDGGDGDGDGDGEEETDDGGSEDAADRDEDEASEGEDEGAEGEDGADDEDDDRVRIDLEGFEARILVLPVEPGSIGDLAGADGAVVYLRRPRTGAGDGEARLVRFEPGADDPEEETILANVDGFQLTADGEKALVRRGDRFAVVELGKDQEFEAIDLSGLTATIDPEAEWRQIVRDAWRLYRDFFYDEGLHGVDWDAIGARYLDALADATSRGDVHWLIGEMISELNAGHAYNRPPPGLDEAPPARPVGLLGCDWTLEQGAYRIARILGSPYDADVRSPLSVPGVDASEGDWLLAVNGRPVDPTRDVYAAFVGTAGKPTWITLSTSPTADGNERDVLVEPLPSERQLRYRDWVARNRALVDELGGGRIGYVHVPDTGVNGQNELVRQFLGQMHRDALVVDERWNGGGQIPTRFIELLDRPITNYWATRHGEDWTWPPVGHRGPKAMLINGASGSGGDCFPYYFRQAGLGTILGTRTWGGLIGISGNPALVDGARPTVPTFGFYELDGTWGVEGYGVPPDIEVVDDPSQMKNGRDPQLLAAIEHLLTELESWPFHSQARPASADRSGTGVTPEDR